MTDTTARIHRLERVQRWALWTALVLWTVGAGISILEHEWTEACTCAGAAIMATIALAASKARNIAVNVVIEHRAKPWVAPRGGGYSAQGPAPENPAPPSGPGAVARPKESR
jgi:hypothetical protein